MILLNNSIILLMTILTDWLAVRLESHDVITSVGYQIIPIKLLQQIRLFIIEIHLEVPYDNFLDNLLFPSGRGFQLLSHVIQPFGLRRLPF